MYFECNLPKEAPRTVRGAKRDELSSLFKNIHKRTNKLNEAFEIVNEISGATGEQFSMAAKLFFDKEALSGMSLLDCMTSKQLAENCINLCCEGFKYEPRIEWKNAITLVDTAFVSTGEWEAIRTIGIGGSDAAVTMGLSPYRTPIELYLDKTGRGSILEDKRDSGKAFIFEYGHRVEDLVINEFLRRTGGKRIPETRMFQKKGVPFINANIDAIVEIGGKLYVFEAKTTTFFNKKAWDDGAVPPQYEPQCRQYMSVLDDPRISGTYIGCVYGNTPSDWACSFIPRDMEAEKAQLELEKAFWETYVVPDKRPELSHKAGDKELLSKIYSKESKEKIDLSPIKNLLDELSNLTDERLSYEKRAKVIAQKEQQIKDQIADTMGNASAGECIIDDKTIYQVSYKGSTRTSINNEALDLFMASLTKEEQELIKFKKTYPRTISVKKKKAS